MLNQSITGRRRMHSQTGDKLIEIFLINKIGASLCLLRVNRMSEMAIWTCKQRDTLIRPVERCKLMSSFREQASW